MNIVHYMFGHLFYMSLGYCTVEVGQYLHDSTGLRTSSVLSTAGVFLLASLIQFCAHRKLAKLRCEQKNQGESDQDYYIPIGFPFNGISCPHYAAEIVIYACLMTIARFHYLWVLMFNVVLFNQLIGALMAHSWYKQRFGDKYPRRRKAIIPFIL